MAQQSLMPLIRVLEKEVDKKIKGKAGHYWCGPPLGSREEDEREGFTLL